MTYITMLALVFSFTACKLKKRKGPPIAQEEPVASMPAKPNISNEFDKKQEVKEEVSVVESIQAEEKVESAIASKELVTEAVQNTQEELSAMEKIFQLGRQAFADGNVPMAKKHYLDACQLGHFHACHKFAYFEQQAGNATNALRFYKVACDQGIQKSCNNFALASEQLGMLEQAKNFYARACLDKHSLSCSNLKRVMELERSQESPR